MGIETTAGATFATMMNALRPMWLDGAGAFFQSSASMLARLEKNRNNVVGDRIEGSRNVGRTEGFGGSHHGANGLRIADPDHAKYGRPRGGMAAFTARGKIEQRTMQMARSAPGAFIEHVRGEMSTLLRDMRYDLSQQIFGDGSGRIGIITAVADQSTNPGEFTVKNVFDQPAHATNAVGDQLYRIRPGMSVAILDTSACTAGTDNQIFHVTVAAGSNSHPSGIRHFKVAAVSGNTVTLTSFAGTELDGRASTTGDMTSAIAVGDYLVRCVVRETGAPTAYTASATAGAAPDFINLTGYRKKGNDEDTPAYTTNVHFGTAELMGLNAYANDAEVYLEMGGSSTAVLGSLCGLSSTTYPDWKGYVDTNSGTARAVDDPMFHKAIMHVEHVGQGRVSNIVCHPNIEERIKTKLLQQNVRYIPTQASNDPTEASVRAMEYQGRPILPEITCPASTAYLIDESEFELKQLMALDYINEDGAVFHRMDDYAAFQFALTYYAQTWCKLARNKFARIDDLSWTA